METYSAQLLNTLFPGQNFTEGNKVAKLSQLLGRTVEVREQPDLRVQEHLPPAPQTPPRRPEMQLVNFPTPKTPLNTYWIKATNSGEVMFKTTVKADRQRNRLLAADGTPFRGSPLFLSLASPRPGAATVEDTKYGHITEAADAKALFTGVGGSNFEKLAAYVGTAEGSTNELVLQAFLDAVRALGEESVLPGGGPGEQVNLFQMQLKRLVPDDIALKDAVVNVTNFLVAIACAEVQRCELALTINFQTGKFTYPLNSMFAFLGRVHASLKSLEFADIQNFRNVFVLAVWGMAAQLGEEHPLYKKFGELNNTTTPMDQIGDDSEALIKLVEGQSTENILGWGETLDDGATDVAMPGPLLSDYLVVNFPLVVFKEVQPRVDGIYNKCVQGNHAQAGLPKPLLATLAAVMALNDPEFSENTLPAFLKSLNQHHKAFVTELKKRVGGIVLGHEPANGSRGILNSIFKSEDTSNLGLQTGILAYCLDCVDDEAYPTEGGEVELSQLEDTLALFALLQPAITALPEPLLARYFRAVQKLGGAYDALAMKQAEPLKGTWEKFVEASKFRGGLAGLAGKIDDAEFNFRSVDIAVDVMPNGLPLARIIEAISKKIPSLKTLLLGALEALDEETRLQFFQQESVSGKFKKSGGQIQFHDDPRRHKVKDDEALEIYEAIKANPDELIGNEEFLAVMQGGAGELLKTLLEPVEESDD